MADNILSTKDPRETIPVTFNASGIPVYSIDGASITITVLSGIDTNASAMVMGAPQIHGTEVVQMIRGGISGVLYNITANIFSGDADYIMVATLPVLLKANATDAYLASEIITEAQNIAGIQTVVDAAIRISVDAAIQLVGSTAINNTQTAVDAIQSAGSTVTASTQAALDAAALSALNEQALITQSAINAIHSTEASALASALASENTIQSMGSTAINDANTAANAGLQAIAAALAAALAAMSATIINGGTY
jgi:hypothetical protein